MMMIKERVEFPLQECPTSVCVLGAFVVVGGADGSVVVFGKQGGPQIIGRLFARGLNNRLLVTIVESRGIAYAGALKGSTDVLVFEVCGWPQLVDRRSDPKLRGLAACDGRRLLCGRGTTSCHVWQVDPWSILFSVSMSASVMTGGFCCDDVFLKASDHDVRLARDKTSTSYVPSTKDVVEVAELAPGAHFLLGGSESLSVAELEGGRAVRRREDLALPIHAKDGRRSEPTTISAIRHAPGCGLSIVVCSTAVALYDVARHELVELGGVRPSVVAAAVGEGCCALASWDAKRKTGAIELGRLLPTAAFFDSPPPKAPPSLVFEDDDIVVVKAKGVCGSRVPLSERNALEPPTASVSPKRARKDAATHSSNKKKKKKDGDDKSAPPREEEAAARSAPLPPIEEGEEEEEGEEVDAAPSSASSSSSFLPPRRRERPPIVPLLAIAASLDIPRMQAAPPAPAEEDEGRDPGTGPSPQLQLARALATKDPETIALTRTRLEFEAQCASLLKQYGF